MNIRVGTMHVAVQDLAYHKELFLVDPTSTVSLSHTHTHTASYINVAGTFAMYHAEHEA
jgi:hypothetical protein